MCIHEWFHHRTLVACRDKKCAHKNYTFSIIIPGCHVQLCACTQRKDCAVRIKEKGNNWKKCPFSDYAIGKCPSVY